jgi:DNA ligase-1
MRAFSGLLERLVLTPSRNRKVELLVHYFRDRPDPDRGYGLAALTSVLDLPSVKPGLFRELAIETTDPELFKYSYDFVGDLAETVALIWPVDNREMKIDLRLAEVVESLSKVSRSQSPVVVRNLLDRLGPSERFALIKLASGGLRVGVSARLAKQALAVFGGKEVEEIEEIWHGLVPPYSDLFAWLEGRQDRPASAALAPFRPVMLSHALDERDLGSITPELYLAEWKGDGIRVQTVAERGVRRLYSRTGDDISAAFPEVVAAMDFDGTIDGELLIGVPNDQTAVIGTFSELQQRLNRKTVTRSELLRYPAFIRTYDLLVEGAADIRHAPLEERKRRLAGYMHNLDPARFDLSPVLEFADAAELEQMRSNPPNPVIEGLMLKRRDAPYISGRPKGPWFKWKKDPNRVDAVLLYAQRGHGKRSGFYSDFTFGVWRGEELVPVGKAYFGFTDVELKQLDKFVRDNTVERFGPVRSVRAEPGFGLVLEVAFEGLSRSSRHKSGVAMRFPRISRIRWDKPPSEADRLEALEILLSPLP